MNITMTINDPIIQKKILDLLLNGEKNSDLYNFCYPETFKNMPESQWEMLLFLADGPKTQEELKIKFGDVYYATLSHITRRIKSVLKKYKEEKEWWGWVNNKYKISEQAASQIRKEFEKLTPFI